jgi:predicted transporter
VKRIRRVVHSVAFYPVTLTYLAGAMITVAVVGDGLRLDIGLVLLGLFAVLVIMLSMSREVGTVHTLVNSQHDALLAKIGAMALRIDELLGALIAAGVSIPQDKAGVDRERKPR